MPQDVVPTAQPSPEVVGPGGAKEAALKQFTEGVRGGDGSFFQQLAGNPFFTAV